MDFCNAIKNRKLSYQGNHVPVLAQTYQGNHPADMPLDLEPQIYLG